MVDLQNIGKYTKLDHTAKKKGAPGRRKGRIRRAVTVTDLQKRAVDNILSGDYASASKAMVAAGYSPTSSKDPRYLLFERSGVKAYLAELEQKSKKKYGMSMAEKTIDVYMGGLEATKLYGKDALEHPDYAVRKAYADKLTEFMGWHGSSGENPIKSNKTQINNFFVTPKEEQESFNKDFKQFMRKVINE